MKRPLTYGTPSGMTILAIHVTLVKEIRNT